MLQGLVNRSKHIKHNTFLAIFTIASFLLILPLTPTLHAADLKYSPTPHDLSVAVFNNSTANVNAQETVPASIDFNDDGTLMYVAGYVSDTFIQYELATAYDPTSIINTFILSTEDPDDATNTNFRPNALDFNSDGTKVFIQGQRESLLLEYDLATPYDLSTAGVPIQRVDLSAIVAVPGGFTFSNDGMSFFLSDFRLDGDGNDDLVYQFYLSAPYAINEITTVTPSSFDFAPDGLTNPYRLSFNDNGDVFYVVDFDLRNGTADTLYEFHLSTPYDVTTAKLDDSINIEALDDYMFGITFNADGSQFFMIGSENDNIHVYDIDYASYPESAANDGSVDNSNPLTITLTDDTFQDADNDDLLDIGTEVTIGNVPAGLTPVLSLSAGDTVATLTFTGNASLHQDSDDVANLTFVFDDSAFVSGDASTVDDSGDAGVYNSHVGVDFNNNPVLTYGDASAVTAIRDLNTPGDYTASSSDLILDGTVAELRQLGFDPATAISLNIVGDTGQTTTPVAGDIDNDGDIDLYVGNNDGQNWLWINDGSGNFTASNIAGDTGSTYGTAIADVDGDGDLDLYAANVRVGEQNHLWINQGGLQGGAIGTFAANHIVGDLGSSNAASFADIDNDGDLDLYVSDWALGAAKLYINDGVGNFTLSNIPGDNTATYGSVFGDVNGDGHLDLYVAHPKSGAGGQNRLWINDGLGAGGASFTAADIPGDLGNSTWPAMGDVDGDGDLDIYVANAFGGQNKLWINDGSGNFTANDIAGDTGSSFGVVMADTDLDGDIDIYVTDLSGQNKLWINQGGDQGGTEGAFLADDIAGDNSQSVRGLVADFNNDGTPDVYAGNWDGQNDLWVSDPHPDTNPYVTANVAVSFTSSITTFTETLGADQDGPVAYQVSSDGGTTWKYWDGGAWIASTMTDGTETSSATDINTHIATLDTDGGDFLWRAYLLSDGTEQIALDQVEIDFEDTLSSSYGYPETVANDGSIDNSEALIIVIAGDTFTGSNGSDLVADGKVTIGNVPAGLTPVLTLSAGNTVATLTFTGTATAHQNTDTITNLTFIFHDAAFANSNAAEVFNAGGNGVYNTNVGIAFEDNPGFTLNKATLSIAENAGTGTFTIALDSEPASDVIITLSSNDKGEATVSPTSLTFTPANWNIPQAVTVTGVDDSIDADHVATIKVSINDTASDSNYAAIANQTIRIVLTDNDISNALTNNGDSDGDGIPDDIEGTNDTDGDGTPDYLDDDADGDGIQDTAEGRDDTDQDGTPDYLDWDSDGDGIPDSMEGDVDSDGDGIIDALDLDSDNDGLFDLFELGLDNPAGLDRNRDGRIDDSYSAGNNGLADVIETAPDSAVLNFNAGDALDTDSDGVYDFRDLDSDNDGVPDVSEVGNNDPDGNGLLGTGLPAVNEHGVPPGGGLTPVDTDGDGLADHLDLDADNDGTFDLVEAGGNDSNDDGIVDGIIDNNGDGLDDGLAMSPLTLPDSDGDNFPDFRDSDDADNDGIPDDEDLDDDNDGIPDAQEGDGAVDTDGDGIADSFDLDSDNDGIFDLIESGLAYPNTFDSNYDGQVDADLNFGANGLADILETNPDDGNVIYNNGLTLDSDNDGIPNFQDLDSDNNGIFDVTENGGFDPDGDGMIGAGTQYPNAKGVLSGAGLAPADLDADNDDPNNQDDNGTVVTGLQGLGAFNAWFILLLLSLMVIRIRHSS